MCGIVGVLGFRATDADWNSVLRRAASTLRHRGPDDEGIWFDAQLGVGLGARRLAIVDLSSAGHQPMVSPSGRYVIAYNGEIYNAEELREQLHRVPVPPRFRGHSDTEVLLAAIEQWGVKAALQAANGMFAFGLWDKKQRVLHLGRDRVGEKPLYYGWQGGVLMFASELKALQVLPGFQPSLNHQALSRYVRYNYIPAPLSVFAGISKLPGGTTLSIGADDASQPVEPQEYWSLSDVVTQGHDRPYAGGDQDAVSLLESTLRKAVRMRMVADVPLGAFLSGGVDSSTVVALMQAQSLRPVRTFSVGFHEPEYNEANHAGTIARYLGTEHTEIYVGSEHASAWIDRIPSVYDEPFADVSQLPTLLVSELAARHVTVALSGDGGDELFGGYNRYLWAASIAAYLRFVPPVIRSRLASVALGLSGQRWRAAQDAMFALAFQGRPAGAASNYLTKLSGVMQASNAAGVYQQLVTHWSEPWPLIAPPDAPHLGGRAALPILAMRDPASSMMYWDMTTYLTDDILIKLDRASMAVSLEARVPLLDPEVIRFAWSLPIAMKIRERQSKWLLRQVLYKYVPRALMDRPKMGFGVPLDSWLRGPLRGWADGLLSSKALGHAGLFNVQVVRDTWSEHQSGRRNWQHKLWSVLMLQLWLERHGNVS
jgi:asparagine synthase (glutamine-hydrolysing)